MAFVNEFIPESDFVNYDIAAINFRYNKSDSDAEWTIDRARDIYLRRVFSGRFEFAGDHGYTLYWKGDLIELELRETGDTLPDLTGWTHYVFLKLILSPHLETQRSEILSDLKEALAARKGAGVYSPRISNNATFNF